MKILKSIAVAFSLYSKIPMPRWNWATDDMKYHLAFFPWVGAVIGCLEYGWNQLAMYYELNIITRLLIMVAIPLIVTGGFHVDGFMDTCDAIHSYGDREKKLNILKDPHIGAFSVICLCIYGLLLISGLAQIDTVMGLTVLAIVPAEVRALAGIIIVTMRPSKEDGMVRTASDNASSKVVFAVLGVTLIVCMGLSAVFSFEYTLAVIVAQVIYLIIFVRMCMREFGGISGDLVGFFISVSELVAVLSVAIMFVWRMA